LTFGGVGNLAGLAPLCRPRVVSLDSFWSRRFFFFLDPSSRLVGGPGFPPSSARVLSLFCSYLFVPLPAIWSSLPLPLGFLVGTIRRVRHANHKNPHPWGKISVFFLKKNNWWGFFGCLSPPPFFPLAPTGLLGWPVRAAFFIRGPPPPWSSRCLSPLVGLLGSPAAVRRLGGPRRPSLVLFFLCSSAHWGSWAPPVAVVWLGSACLVGVSLACALRLALLATSACMIDITSYSCAQKSSQKWGLGSGFEFVPPPFSKQAVSAETLAQ